nr:extensin-like [Aegilops tauschii subsp. strangulata]
MSSAAPNAAAASAPPNAAVVPASAVAPSSPFLASRPLATTWWQAQPHGGIPAGSLAGSGGQGDLPPPISSGCTAPSTVASAPPSFRGHTPVYGAVPPQPYGASWYGAPAPTYGAVTPPPPAWPAPLYGPPPASPYVAQPHPHPYAAAYGATSPCPRGPRSGRPMP